MSVTRKTVIKLLNILQTKCSCCLYLRNGVNMLKQKNFEIEIGKDFSKMSVTQKKNHKII